MVVGRNDPFLSILIGPSWFRQRTYDPAAPDLTQIDLRI